MVIWITGLAGAGKTTIGREVYSLIRARKPNVLFLDGGNVRAIMGNDLGYTIEDRMVAAWRFCRLCHFLDSQEIDVVCATLTVFPETQEWSRRNLSQYFDGYIEMPMDVLVARDKKGLYSRALRKEISDVVGVDIPFSPPPHPDLVVYNGEPTRPPAILAGEILRASDETFRQRDGQHRNLQLPAE